MIDAPQITHTDARPAAVIHFTIPRAQIRDVMGPGIVEVLDAVAARGMTPAGPVFSHHLRMHPETFDFEVGVPVPQPIEVTGRVVPGELPAARIARTIYHGPYEGLAAAWDELDAWLKANGHTPAPDLWECYVAGPESGEAPAAWRTELNRPLAAPS